MVFVLSAAIIGIAWLLRRPMKMIGLPIVIGEMLAGFLLGPTFFGRLAPHAFSTLFSSESLHQIGRLAGFIITAYYFVIGLEFDGRHLKGQYPSLILTALLSGLLPAAFGFLLAGPVAAKIGMATPLPFKFALALVFSVTAFPVLLRMLENAGYDKHSIGTFSMGSTGFLELLIWASLPVILALATAGSLLQAFVTISWTVLFLVTWFTLVRKGLQWLWCKIPSDGAISLLPPILVGIVSAYIAGHIAGQFPVARVSQTGARKSYLRAGQAAEGPTLCGCRNTIRRHKTQYGLPQISPAWPAESQYRMVAGLHCSQYAKTGGVTRQFFLPFLISPPFPSLGGYFSLLFRQPLLFRFPRPH